VEHDLEPDAAADCAEKRPPSEPVRDHVPLTSTPPGGGAIHANSACDLRTDVGEMSVKCLSYATNRTPVTLYTGATGTENTPYQPALAPLTQYTNLFSGFVPAPSGNADGGVPVADAMLKQLVGKRSVLDFALDEVSRLKTMGPSDARAKLQNHYDAVSSVEQQLINAINKQYPVVTGTGNGACPTTPGPPPDISGPPDYTSGSHGNAGSPTNGSTNDMATHETVGRLHMEVFRAAFLCDIIRCGTFLWAPGTSHVAFQGMYPGDPTGLYQHYATSRSVGSSIATTGKTPDDLGGPAIRFLFNVETWYFARHAENLKLWKDSFDAFGNPLLDTTIIPFITEVGQLNHDRSNIPAMIFGGKKLGMAVGQYKTGGTYTVNSFWGAIARAFGYDPTAAPGYDPTTAAIRDPIAGLWSKPA